VSAEVANVDAVSVSLPAENAYVEVIPPAPRNAAAARAETGFPVASSGVTLIVAFSNGAYEALSN